MSTEFNDIVTLDQFQVGAELCAHFDMPVLARRLNEITYVVVKPEVSLHHEFDDC